MYNRRAGSQRSLLASFAPSPRQVVTVHESSLLLVHTIVGKTCKRRPCLMADRCFPTLPGFQQRFFISILILVVLRLILLSSYIIA